VLPADVDTLYATEAEQAALLTLLDQRYAAILAAVHELVAAAFAGASGTDEGSLGLDFQLDQAALRALWDEAAVRAVQIDETTRAALGDLLATAQERGYSAWQLANGVPDDGYAGIAGLYEQTWAARAETIAGSEIAWAMSLAALNRYAATGRVSRVRILEATDTDKPCADRAGMVVPITARPMPLHPNCRLQLQPVLDD